MRVGLIGTGGVAHKHVQSYRNIGYRVVTCAGIDPVRGKRFAGPYGCEPRERWQDICCHPEADFIDFCTFPDFRLEPVELCAQEKKHVQVQKPMATNLDAARAMLEAAREAGILLGVVSQHRFDTSA